jgi:hypothetical protein
LKLRRQIHASHQITKTEDASSGEKQPAIIFVSAVELPARRLEPGPMPEEPLGHLELVQMPERLPVL